MPISMLHTLANRLRQNVDRSLARLAAEPEYPDNDFVDDPTMQEHQTFLAARVTPDDALRAGSGFVGILAVPLSRVLPLVPRSDMDAVADALDLDDTNRARVRQATETPRGCELRSGTLDIRTPSFRACADSLIRSAHQYNRGVSSACSRAAIDLRRSDVKIRGSYVNHVAGKEIRSLYDRAKSLRASTDATREFVREYDRASDMLAVRHYLAADKAGDPAMVNALREESAVSLFLRCGDLDLDA